MRRLWRRDATESILMGGLVELEQLVAKALCGFAKLLTGVRSLWLDSPSDAKQRIYFANHTSHVDAILIWASLPGPLRRMARPVAAADYWLKGPLRRYVSQRVFRCVLIDRVARLPDAHPVEQMIAPLQAGDSLIIFPEGTRNAGEGLLPFKSGIYYLAKARPEIELVPVWIENLGRVLPKGTLIPVPLLCSLRFGRPLQLTAGEEKSEFLERAKEALLKLAPADD